MHITIDQTLDLGSVTWEGHEGEWRPSSEGQRAEQGPQLAPL